MSAETVSQDSLLVQEYRSFVGEHTFKTDEEIKIYYRQKQLDKHSGQPTWELRNPDADLGAIYDLWYRQNHLGFIEVDGIRTDVYLQQGNNKSPKLIQEFNNDGDKAYNVLMAKDFLDSHVRAHQAFELFENLQGMAHEEIDEYEENIQRAKEDGEEVLEIEIPDDFTNGAFILKLSVGKRKLGEIVYVNNKLCEVFVGTGDNPVDEFSASDLPKAIHQLRALTVEY